MLPGELPISSKAQNLAKHSLNDWRQWQLPFHSRPKIVEQLEGGLTNSSFVIASGSQRAVLRVNNPEADKLGVNRQTEITIFKQLQSTELVPRLYFADSHFLVSEYIDGVVLDDGKVTDPSVSKQIEQAIAVIQNQAIADIEVRNYQAYVLGYCDQLSSQYLDKSIRQSLLQIARDIDAQDWNPVICHHDLIPENIILSSCGLRIIDWEYAAVGHPQFDYLRLTNSHHIMDVPPNICELQALQASLIHLWYAIRYPELRGTVQHKLLKIIDTVGVKS